MINLADHKDAICARLRKITAKDWQNRLQAKGYDVIVTNNMKNKKTPTNTESLIKLKNQGYHYRIQHLRKVKALDIGEDGLYCYKVDPVLHNDSFVRKVNKDVAEDEIPYFKYLPEGGATEMRIQKDDEEIVVRATCYAKDKFSRRIGVLNCLEKLKNLYNIGE